MATANESHIAFARTLTPRIRKLVIALEPFVGIGALFVFFTFALSGPLPPKEIGVILGIAVLLDAMLSRLVLIPTLLRVLGHRARALPHRLDRILPDVTFGHG
jgi:uncharacterized membrane protein YdfJ with MMPL/SSD domain